MPFWYAIDLILGIMPRSATPDERNEQVYQGSRADAVHVPDRTWPSYQGTTLGAPTESSVSAEHAPPLGMGRGSAWHDAWRDRAYHSPTGLWLRRGTMATAPFLLIAQRIAAHLCDLIPPLRHSRVDSPHGVSCPTPCLSSRLRSCP